MIVTDGANDVALHDLHVINVVEEFESITADRLAEFDAPRGAVAHVVAMVNLGVEQFHDDSDAACICKWCDATQPDGAVLESFGIRQSGAVTTEDDHLRNSGGGNFGQERFALGD